MTVQGKKFLSDILTAIEFIETFIKDTPSFEEYTRDIKTQSANERQLGIIGEAINKYDKLFPGDSLENVEKIIGLRNRIIHAYDSIDDSIIWTIVRKYLDPLKIEVISKLK